MQAMCVQATCVQATFVQTADLLKGVELKNLEAEDVEQPDELHVLRVARQRVTQRAVDAHHEVVKDALVDCLTVGVSPERSLDRVEINLVRFVFADFECGLEQCSLHGRGRRAEQLGRQRASVGIGHIGLCVVLLVTEFEIAEREDA